MPSESMLAYMGIRPSMYVSLWNSSIIGWILESCPIPLGVNAPEDTVLMLQDRR